MNSKKMARNYIYSSKIRKNRRHKRNSQFLSHRKKIRLISLGATLVLVGVIALFALSVATLAFFSRDLPSPYRLTQRETPQSTKIFSREGQLLYEIFADERRTLIEFKDIPECVKQATLAVEDAEFYKHQGFDLKGSLYAFYQVVVHRRLQGGSTITQQLVKNTLLSQERTLTRKIKELILAIQIERKYTKDEILQMYLNEAPYGGQTWGIGAASEMYFGKHVRDINLAEAAFLAGLPQSPSLYSPYGSHPEYAKQRQSYVLHLMVKNDFITQEETDQAKNEELRFLPRGENIKAPHFVMFVKEALVKEFGEKMVEQGGLRVKTTLDMSLQEIAEEEVRYQLDRLKENNAKAGNAGLVAVNPQTGEILAMVGSRDYFDIENDGNVNVTLASRQPGSAIKPIMYVTAFQMGYTPATFLSDIYTCFSGGVGQPNFCPEESDGKYWGPMLLRDALANSRNVPATKMLQLVGIQSMLDTAHTMGITTLNEPERYGLSLTLGGGEVKPIDMAQSFSVFATGGIKHNLVGVLKVEDSQGRVLQEFKLGKGQRVLEEKYTYLVNSILSDNETRKRLFGARNLLEIGRPAAVKTGTTNDNRDAWTVGYTPSLCAAVWVGNNDNSPMAPTIQGSTGATPIWHFFMQKALEGKEIENWEKPEEIVEATVDALSGKVPQVDKNYPVRREIFIKGTEPVQIDDFHQVVTLCKDYDLLATDYHKKIGDVREVEYKTLIELNSEWQEYTDRMMEKVEGYSKPPTGECPITRDHEVVEGPIIEIINPEDGATLEVYGFDVETEVYSNKVITKVEFFWDDVLVDTLTSIPYTATYSLSMKEIGEHEIMVKAYDSEGNVGTQKITVSLPQKIVPTPNTTPTPTPISSSEKSRNIQESSALFKKEIPKEPLVSGFS